MDSSPERHNVGEQLLRVEAATCIRQPLVAPVALERKYISMLNPSERDPTSVHSPGTTAPSTSATITSTSTSTTSTDMTSSTTPTSAPSAPPTSTVAAAPKAVPSASPAQVLKRPSPIPGASTPTLPAAATIVGEKRPLGEESPVIILTEPRDEDGRPESVTPATPGPGVRLTRQPPAARQSPLLRQRKPEETTTNLSTQEESRPERGRPVGRQRDAPGVQASDASPKRDVSHVMQFFQEQEKSLQEHFLSLPKRSLTKQQQHHHQQQQRSPSPKLVQAAGLEHLDNLIRLMEQLSSLRDENSRLRKRCDFLESTKVLLQAKRDLSLEGSDRASSSGLPTLSKHRHHHHHHHHHAQEQQQQHQPRDRDKLDSKIAAAGLRPGMGRISRPRISSAEELEYIEIADSSSDQAPKKPKKVAMHKRSFSTGSLEVPSEMTSELGVDARKRVKAKTGRGLFGKPTGSKQKSKSSKWARVKKVLTGQKIYEDLGTTIRTLRDLGRSTQVRYSSTAGAHDFSTTPRVLEAPLVEVTSVQATAGARSPLSVAPVVAAGSPKGKDQALEDSDLTTEIWMGPPGWWQEYEARKESGGTSSASEASSVIEVTTMYLGSSRKETTALTTSTSSATTTVSSFSTTPVPSPASPQDSYLSIDKSLPRRQSSPSLVMSETAEEEDDILKELTTGLDTARVLHKSSSCKSADLDIPSLAEGRPAKKTHRSAWGRVKDIIHTRKDSIKKKPKRGRSGLESEETSEIDIEGLLEEHQWRSDVFDEGIAGRSTPKSSPLVVRQQGGRSISDHGTAPPSRTAVPSRGGSYHAGTSPGPADMAALLAGSVTDEFSRKMREWEQLRSKKSSIRMSLDENDMVSLDIPSPVPTLEQLGRGTEATDHKGQAAASLGEVVTPEEPGSPVEMMGSPGAINMEEMQRRITDSFSRKMQEWEKLKYKGITAGMRETSPDSERRDYKSRKDERQKSKRSREEKEKEKMERQREREIQKVEREQMKIEKEKLRLEKERLRTLEREAKLEKLKDRLSQAETDGSFRRPATSTLAEYKVTADFARKLREWELKKGLSHDVSNSIYLEAQKMSMQHLGTGQQSEADPRRMESPGRFSGTQAQAVSGNDKAPPPPPLTLQSFWDSPEDTSPVEKYSDVSVGDGDDETCTSVTGEALTRSHILSLERANVQLLETLQRKELEYSAIQEDVLRVNDKLTRVRQSHAVEMARFHRELARGGKLSSPLKLEVAELESSMVDLEDKIKKMENFGQKLASSMESAAIGKWQSIEGEETVHTQLVELVDQMRGMLVQASQSEEQSQKTMALSSFETLYTQAMKLQVQMNNLRLSHLERNREILDIKRQLLLQEVNNLLLQADIGRREAELYQVQETRRFSTLKRWNTFSGAGRQREHLQMDLPELSAQPAPDRETRVRLAGIPRVNIPFISEDQMLASAASSSLSAPASPLSIATAGDASGSPYLSPGTGQPLPSPGATHGQELPRTQVTSPAVRWDHAHDPQGTSSSGPDATSSLQIPRLEFPASLGSHPPESKAASSSPTSERTPPVAIESPVTTSYPVQPPRIPASVLDVTSSTRQTLSIHPHRQFLQGETKPHTDTSTRPKVRTICDSAPLHLELRELRKEKRKVEKGPPTLRQALAGGPSLAPSPRAVLQQSSREEVHPPTIPKQPSPADTPGLAQAASIIDDDYSPATSVMECTDALHILDKQDSELGAVGGSTSTTRDHDTRPDRLTTSEQPKRDSGSAQSRTSRFAFPVSSRDVDETRLKDVTSISPKSSPRASRGKPPLPRYIAAAKQSHSASLASEKGPRSKSVSDMDDRVKEAPISKPLQEAIDRFEKRATVCETEHRPIELRKTPSPTLHLPRVGLVSRVRRLKPAAELLEESQRYRSGHSIYATRILQRYLHRDDHRSDRGHVSQDKENNQHGPYVTAIIQRLSRETTPAHSPLSSRTNSDLSLKAPDSPRAQSEFVTHIVRKLSSPSDATASRLPAPLKDVTNEGQVKQMQQAFSIQQPAKASERTLSDSDIERQRSVTFASAAAKSQYRKSCEVAVATSSALSSAAAGVSFPMGEPRTSQWVSDSFEAAGASLTPPTCMSMPTMTSESSQFLAAAGEDTTRTRAATYCVSEADKPATSSFKQGAKLAPPSSSSPGTSHAKAGPELMARKSPEKPERDTKEKAPTGRLPSPLSPSTKGAGRGRMGTVGVLCKQSISFDLGVSLYSQKSPDKESSKSRQAHSWDPSETVQAESRAVQQASSPESSRPPRAAASTSSDPGAAGSARPMSTSSEGELESPPSTGKKKSSWLQKSKKFFKASK